jgi:hypothetical protein
LYNVGPDAIVKDEVGGADIDLSETEITESKSSPKNPGSSIVLSPRYHIRFISSHNKGFLIFNI